MAGKTIVHRAAGTAGPTRTSYGINRSLLESAEVRETYRGELTEAFSAYGLLATNAARANIQQDGAIANIEIIKKDIATQIATVEIDFNSVQREWWTCPEYSTITGPQRVQILGKLRELEEYAGSGHTPAEIEAERARLSAQLGSLSTVFDDIILNGETYTALLPVVTFTLSVAKNYPIPFVIADMGKVFSTAAVLAELPAVTQFQIAEITNTVAANSLQTLGWLKSGRYAQSSDGGVQYVQQYTFDSWPTNRYEFV